MGYGLPEDLIALAAVGVLLLALRLVWGGRRRYRSVPVDAAASRELGLLRVLVANVSRADGLRIQSLLRDVDVRASLSKRRDGGLDVLVFTEDVERATRALLP